MDLVHFLIKNIVAKIADDLKENNNVTYLCENDRKAFYSKSVGRFGTNISNKKNLNKKNQSAK